MQRQQMAKQALAFLDDQKLKPLLGDVGRAGIQTLLGAVQRAGSLEEIEIVLRYQAARSREGSRPGEDGRYHPELERHLVTLLRAASGKETDPAIQARAAADQLAMIARVHRVITADARNAGRERGDAD